MDPSKKRDDDILDLLIIGAGPVGLTAALEAKRLGLSVRIVERKTGRTTNDSRAVVVHPRVMELLYPIRDGALTKELDSAAFPLRGMRAYIGKENSGDNSVLADFTKVNWGDTEFPNLRFLPQYETERCLEEAFIAEGGKVGYGTVLKDLVQEEENGGVVRSTLVAASSTEGEEETVVSRWVIGADGGRSKTRESIGVELTRHRSDLYFVAADIVLKGEDIPLGSHAPGKGGHFFPSIPIAMIPLPGKNSYRLIGKAPAGITSPKDTKMDEAFFQDYLKDQTGKTFEVELGEWRSIFEVTHGTTECYRKGNVILAGDAAHVHSPVGGQGMNLGMQDSCNLLWKLAWAKRILSKAAASLSTNESSDDDNNETAVVDSILQTYHTERHGLGRETVGSVEMATKMLALDSSIVTFFRNQMVKFLLPSEFGRNNFRKVGQLEMAYQPSWSNLILEESTSFWTSSSSSSYICAPGQRLPNILLQDGSKLYSRVDRTRFTWVVLNHHTDAFPVEKGFVEVVAAIADEQVSDPPIPAAAYAAPQVLLVRPDQFVAGVGPSIRVLKDRLKREAGLTEIALETM